VAASPGRLPRVSDRPGRRDWVTTAQVATAARVHQSTISRWRDRGLLPEPAFVTLGRRGRSQRWPPQTTEQARWVKDRLEDGWTFEEVLQALERGEFKPSSSEP